MTETACKETARLLGTYTDGQLDAAKTLEVDDHLASCEVCNERIALDRAAALDMAVAVSAYQEARPGERAKRATAVGAAVGRFAADVDAVVRSVSTVSGDMRTAAQSLSADAGDAARQAA